MVRAEAAGIRTCSLRRGVGGSSFKLPVASCFVTESKNMRTQYTDVCTDVSFTKAFITSQTEMALGLKVVELQNQTEVDESVVRRENQYSAF